MWLEAAVGRKDEFLTVLSPQPPSQGVTDWRCCRLPFAICLLCLKVQTLSWSPLLILSWGKLWFCASSSSFLGSLAVASFLRGWHKVCRSQCYITGSNDLLYCFKRRWWRHSSASFRPTDWAPGLADLLKWCGIRTSNTFPSLFSLFPFDLLHMMGYRIEILQCSSRTAHVQGCVSCFYVRVFFQFFFFFYL